MTSSSTNALRAKICVAAGVSLAVVVAYLRRRRMRPRNVKKIPGHWLLGNTIDACRAVVEMRLHDYLSEVHEQHGDTLWCELTGQPPIISTVDPAVVEHVLKTNFENYPKGSLLKERLTDLLGDGIFNVDGDLWHLQRKKASHMFTANKFKNHIWRVVEKNSKKVVDILHGVANQQPNTKFDVFQLLNRFTLDSIGEIGYGASIGSLEHPDCPFLKSFDIGQSVVMKRFFFPGWQVLRFFGLGFEKGAFNHFSRVKDYSLSIVQDMQGRLDVETEEADSFVGIFMRAQRDQGQPIDDIFTRDLVLNFLLAGRDTTAQAIAWCLYELMLHPEIEEKIVQEAKQVCGSGPVTYDNINNLQYLQAVVNECMRLHPPVPLDPKICMATDKLPGGIIIPAGSTIWYSSYGMGRNKRIWGEDAAQFKPERWLSFTSPPDSYKYPVFHAGPRECLGKRLAQVEIKGLLANIIREVSFTLAVPKEAIKQDFQLTIGMSSGLPVYVKARSKQ